MDQLLAQRTLSLLHHLMRLVLQLHGSILANIEGLESQVGHRGTTLSPHHPYSSSMAAWRLWTYPFYYQGYPLHPLTQHIPQPWHHFHTSNLQYTHHTIMPQNALSVHNHAHLQQNITASTPQPTLQHHQPHPEQQIPLLHHADQKHQEQGVTHQTQTTPPAISH